jgi:hypothetical protein
LKIIHKPTNIYGLKYEPSFELLYYNSLDGFSEYDRYVETQWVYPLYHGPIDFTEDNKKVLEQELNRLHPCMIMEIGVARQNPNSTQVLLDYANCNATTYIGIDLRNVQELHNPTKSYFIQENSHNLTGVCNKLNEYGIEGIDIDLLFIDGNHSINSVLQEWTNYVPMIERFGTIIFHDVNHHPGPREVFDAIDDNLFEKEKLCPNDYGIGIVRKK